MTKEEFLTGARELSDQALATLALKNADYAVGDDPFHNFETVAQFLGTTRERVLATYLYKHLSAIFAYTRGEYADSEPIQGRIIDAINYLLFLNGMNEEAQWGGPQAHGGCALCVWSDREARYVCNGEVCR